MRDCVTIQSEYDTRKKEEDMRTWRDNIRTVEPYTPGEQPKDKNVIKLNTNENPYGPSPRVSLLQEDMEELRLYPDPAAALLTDGIADYHGVDAGQVFVGVGSDDVLAMAFMTFFNSSLPILFPDVTYSFYDVWAELFRIPYEQPKLDPEFRIRKEDYYKENGGVIFPNPNAPTGICEGLEFVEDILRHNQDAVVIVDEAYIDFGGQSALPLLDQYDNLLIVRTFSKSRSMAGLRIGYAIGSPELIQAMSNVKYSFNSYTMNRPALLLGAESLKDEEYFRETIEKIIRTRTWFGEELKKLGFTFPESKANFLFARHERENAEDIFIAAKQNGIYLRHFDQPRVKDYLRITVGTDAQMQALLEFLKNYLN